jgi:hypothetical protein
VQWYGKVPVVPNRCEKVKGASWTPESHPSGDTVRVVECPLDIQRHSTVSPTEIVVVSVPLSSSRNTNLFPGPTSTIFVAAEEGAARRTRASVDTEHAELGRMPRPSLGKPKITLDHAS